MRRTIQEWAKEYVGDPNSFHTRGALCLDFLKENGLEPHHKVLDLGCGNLSQGKPLIEYLNDRNYVGLEPNGWLVEAGLLEFPHLEAKNPRFTWRTDFDPSGFETFDYVIAHSVLSHVADWQLEQALLNIRKNVVEGGLWIASLRLDQYDSGTRRWAYPDVSYFRLDTVKTIGYHAGWHVEQLPTYRERMMEVAPNDHHNWLRLTAVPSAAEQNQLRQEEEERRNAETEILKIAQDMYARNRELRLNKLRKGTE